MKNAKKFIAICISLLLVAACGKTDDATVRVLMKTSAGDMVIALYTDKAPVTASNFLRYVDEGHFESARFYRVTRPDNDPMIEVIQGGIWPAHDEDWDAPLPPIEHETTDRTGLAHIDGAISMARNEPGSASSEFFISIGANPELDYAGERNPDGQGFAVFGQVVEGLDVAHAINAAPVNEGEGFEGQLLREPVEIIAITRQ